MRNPVETIHRAIELIEAHLQQEITVAEIAAAVGYSLFHFVRTFDRVVQLTPYDYLMRRRLSEAAHALSSSDRRIIDISQDFCFNNHETFSRAFKRMFAMQPNQWRENGFENSASLMPPLTLQDLRYTNQDSFMPPIIEELESIQLCGLMSILEDVEHKNQPRRNRLLTDVYHVLGDAIPVRLIGMTTYVDENRRNAYYRIGVEKAALKTMPSTFVEFALPAGKYACISASEDDTRSAIKYLLYTWFPRNRLDVCQEMEVEMIHSTKELTDLITICIPLHIYAPPMNF
jgi:AraC family transcriptional regulator